jgi:hypothetical protein
MEVAGVDIADEVDSYIMDTGDEDPQSVSERVYNIVEDRVFEETEDFAQAQELGAEAAEAAMEYVESEYGDM